MRDLSEVRAAYERGEGSLQTLAERFSVPVSTVKKRAAKESWYRSEAADGKPNRDMTDQGQAREGAENGTIGMEPVEESGTAPPEMEPLASGNGTESGTAPDPVTQNGTVKMEPVPKSGTGNGTAGAEMEPPGSENGTKSGTTGGAGSENGTAKMEPVPKSGTENGTADEVPSLPVGPENGTGPTIPSRINELSRLEAAQFYSDELGWAVHPLASPKRGDAKTKGKKPVLTGWRQHQLDGVTPEFLVDCFEGTPHNLGVVVRPPYVHVDLDSKRDKGRSVAEWLEGMPELAGVPRERTGGGAHLVFICRDLPDEVMKAKQAPTAKINEAVTAELYKDGLNLVLSPSVHPNGHQYHWEVTGPIPEVSWEQLCGWFGFATPESKTKPKGRPTKELPWWAKYPEDLRTLDLVGVMREFKMIGRCLDGDTAKWAVRCPWESEHGTAEPSIKSDTAIFNAKGVMPAFCCLHAHCAERELEHLVEWIEKKKPGTIAAKCTRMREYRVGNKDEDGRPEVVLPGDGRPQSEFATELGEAVAPKLDLFYFSENVVEVRQAEAHAAPGGVGGDLLHPLRAVDLVSAVERSVTTGLLRTDESGTTVFLPRSLIEADARITLVNRQFLKRLPRITRVLDVPVPLLGKDGELIYPKHGYDEQFRTWLSPKAPQLRTMGLDEALDLLMGELLAKPEDGGFWWRDEQSRIHALARLITPMCRGLMDWKRPPLWIFDGNREGSGKDTCANVTYQLYTGRAVIGAPSAKDGEEELRKRITSALITGARFFHLANMKGHIRYACLEAATDNSGVWEDRLLGVSRVLQLPNETEFSISANNATWEPDIERRCRRIRLSFFPEYVNGHRYRHPRLDRWIAEHRAALLSAVNALIIHWVRHGCPAGPSPFTSFPEWGEVVGGILHSCGLGDPCLPHEDSETSGDQNTRAMRQFFALGFERFGDREVLKGDFQAWIQDEGDVHDLFDWLDFAQRRGLISFGKLVAKFDGRELGGIAMRVRQTSKNRGTYQFLPVGGNAPGPAGPDEGDGGLDFGSGAAPEVTTNAPKEPSSGGVGDVGGSSSPSVVAEEKKERKTKVEKSAVLNAPYRTVGNTSPDIPNSPARVLHTSRSGLQTVADDLAGASRIALDLETYGPGKGDGLNPWRGEIRLLTLSRHCGTIHTLDLRAIGYDLGPLAPVLEAAELVAHNCKFDLLWLRVKCGLQVRRARCTLTASRLLTAGTHEGNNLDECLERYLKVPPGPDHSRSDWGSMLLSEEQLAYAARDVAHLHDLLGTLEHELEIHRLDEVWHMESQLLPCAVDMEEAGIHVSTDKLKRIATKARERAAVLKAELCQALGDWNLNPDSPKQLLAALQGAGLPVEKTREEDLKAADDDRLVPMVLGYRGATKLVQQAESLIKRVEADGRIHGRFEPTGTVTGRFSSRDPNLQNIGREKLREAFTAPEGRSLVVADYSQVELRAAAAITGEKRMLDAYRKGADLHRLTAATVLRKTESDVSPEDRQLAKAVNFGLIYGLSARRLVNSAKNSYGVDLDPEQAKSIRKAFFDNYRKLKSWHGRSWLAAEQQIGEVRTRSGRRRLIPPHASEWERFTALVNTPVQGGTADGMKKAIILVSERLPEGTRIVSTVHDELVIECDEGDADAVSRIVSTSMVEAMSELFPEVPMEVEPKVCTSWGEK